ncbi:transcriptional regulator GutM [Candidatus Enterococcus ferrettii]|uniref:Glucitol operon activator protein n=1 Tax=Candidatus Enterococcus ferrettii TaxID=2815324 RepID=A0ABV0ESW0_9ENTE|nr:transcriptional regulator GutM [Enterococcus sp. 665A]MBO1341501.1 hypothetical protein [Enterococcus sp. 665A]
MHQLLIVLFVLMMIQSLGSIFQVKYYQGFIKKITVAYQNHAFHELYTDVSKGSLFKTIVAVVADQNNKIISCYVCKGFTIFARFKQEPSYQGINLAEIHDKKMKQTRLSQVESVLEKIYLRKLEAVAHIIEGVN